MAKLLLISLLGVLIAAALAENPHSDENVRGRSISGSGSGSGSGAGGREAKRPSSDEEEDGRGRSASAYGSASGSGSAGRRSKRPQSSEESSEENKRGRSARREESSEENERGRSLKRDESSEENERGRSLKRDESSEENERGRSLKRDESSEENERGRSLGREESSEEKGGDRGRSARRGRDSRSEESSEERARSVSGSGSGSGSGSAGRSVKLFSSEEAPAGQGRSVGSQGASQKGRFLTKDLSSEEEPHRGRSAASFSSASGSGTGGRSVSGYGSGSGSASGQSGRSGKYKRRNGKKHHVRRPHANLGTDHGRHDYKASSTHFTKVDEHNGGKNVEIKKEAAVNHPDGGKGSSASHTKVNNKNHAKEVEVVKKAAVNHADGSKSSSSKVIKVEEKSKDKDILISKHTLVNRPSTHETKDVHGSLNSLLSEHEDRSQELDHFANFGGRSASGKVVADKVAGSSTVPPKGAVKVAVKQEKVISNLVDKLKDVIKGSKDKNVDKKDLIHDLKNVIKDSKHEIKQVKQDLKNIKKAANEPSASSSQSNPKHKLDGNPRPKNSNCLKKNPQPIDPESEFAKIFHTHEAYVPLANREYYDMYSEVLTGKKFREHKPSESCLRLIWDPRHRRVMGFGQKSLLNCKSQHGFTEVNECHRPDKKNNPMYGGHFEMTSVLTDGESAFLRVGCTSKGRAIWGILSNNETLPKDVEEKFLRKVSELGLSRNDVERLGYEKCEDEIQDDVNEGPCLHSVSPAKNIQRDAVLQILENGVYTVLSSELNIYASALFVRQSPLQHTEDFDSVCAFQKYEKKGEDHEIHMSAFRSKKEVLECDTEDLGHMTCRPDEEDKDDKDPFTYQAGKSVIWTDNKKNVLMYNCLSDNLKSWALYSSENTPVEADLRSFILAKVADYGFDPVKSWTFNYARCSHLNTKGRGL